MLGAKVAADLFDVLALVKRAPLKSDRERLQTAQVGIRGIVQDGGGIHAATRPDPHWNIRHQLLTHGFLQQVVKFFAGLFHRTWGDSAAGYGQKGGYGRAATMPLQQFARHQLDDALDHGVRTRHIVQAKKTVQAGKAEFTFRLRGGQECTSAPIRNRFRRPAGSSTKA